MRLGTILMAVLALVVGATQAHAQEKRIALLIGNQTYDPSVGVLQNPHNDIRVVGAALKRQGFEVLPEVRDARRSAILGAVRQLRDRLIAAGPGAVGFVYYSGHGAAEADTGVNYLIPVDAKQPGSAEFWDESLKLDDILKLLDGARGAAKFIVFDACRNELRVPAKSTTKGLAPIAEQQGMLIAYATSPGRTASDQGQVSGPFAAALAAELGKPGLDHLNLFQNVKETVLASTNGVQQPWINDGLARRVQITTPAVGTVSPSPAAPPAAAPQAPMSEAAQAWAAAKDTTNVAVLEAFVRRFGDSFYGDLARARIDELNRRTAASKAEAERLLADIEKKTAALTMPPSTKGRPPRCDGVDVALGSGGTACVKPGSGQTFRDCPDCPEMVVVPAGSFMMGSDGAKLDEKPVHRVSLVAPLAVGKFELTFAEWDACAAAGGCVHKPDDKNWGRGQRPVINVSWDDARDYVAWLSRTAKKTYRLLTEAEWEYAARAGTTTKYSWGDEPGRNNAHCDGCASQWNNKQTAPVGSFAPNAFGLHDMHGNVDEWVEDCYADSYAKAPTDGSKASDTRGCSRVVRGGSWLFNHLLLRVAYRSKLQPDVRGIHLGFRVGRTF